MKVKHLVIEKVDDFYSVVKNTKNNKYIKLGLREVLYLFDVLEVETVQKEEWSRGKEVGILNHSEKEFINLKFEEWGFLQEDCGEEESTPEKRDWSKIKIWQINPEAFLKKIPYIWTNLYTGVGFAMILVFVLSKYLVLIPNFTDICSAVLNIKFSVWNVIAFYVLAIGSGILHEFGHALACKHYGGKISSMGIMLYFLSPVMYCDVSDVYLMRNKKAGIYVALAGVFTEMLVGSLWVWAYLLIDILFNVQVVVLLLCWLVNMLSILVNLFPFVKYDGYWVLTSMLNVTNLMDKATTFFIARACGGKDIPKEIPYGRRTFLFFYGAMALLCRVLFWGFAVYNVVQVAESVRIDEKLLMIVVVAISAAILRVEFRFCKEQIKKYKVERKRILGLLVVK